MPSKVNENTRFAEGLSVPEKTDNITTATAPSAAECVTAFGAAASHNVPSGYHKYLGVIDDNGAGTNAVHVWTDGTAFFYVSLTKAS